MSTMAPAAQLAALLSQARRVAFFTGAGVSTESGISDFRSPGGVWSRMKPITFQEFTRDPDKRKEAWTRVFSDATGWTGREPNQGHFAIARLIHAGKASAVITQNVDDLHQVSGVSADQVIELHGNASYATCLDCRMRHEFEDLREAFLATGEAPACRRCGGWEKTATVSFGQAMPEAEMTGAETHTHACDLFLALGSSLKVFPAATFPILAKRSGARLAIVNREPTELDDYADLVLNVEIGPTLSETVDRCLGSTSKNRLFPGLQQANSRTKTVNDDVTEPRVSLGHEARRIWLIEDVKSQVGIIDDLGVHPSLRFEPTKSFSKAAWPCGIVRRDPVRTC